MKHETILVPVSCSERLPNKDKKYLTTRGEAYYFTRAQRFSFYKNGDELKVMFLPDFWYEEQIEKYVLSEEEFVQMETHLQNNKEMCNEYLARIKQMGEALKYAHSVLDGLAEEGRFPYAMLAENGGQGFKPITDALKLL